MRAPFPGSAPGMARQPIAAVALDRRFRVHVVAAAVAVCLAHFAVPVSLLQTMPAAAADMSKRQPTVAEPDNYRMDNYRAPVPATLKGAKVVTPEEARDLWLQGGAVFIDAYPHAPKPANLPKGTIWREPTHFSIEKGIWLANTGYGVLSRETEAYFKRHLHELSGGDKTKALVFFCLRNCWMSWNAAKRAMTYGYTNVIWYPEGFDAWQEIGEPIEEVKPAS